jgi:hypothetical protein
MTTPERLAAPEGIVATADLPAGLAPGTPVPVDLGLLAPRPPGTYLLVLDVVTPEHGSLSALGAGPTLVLVTVRTRID